MTVMLISFAVFILVITGMSVGVIFGKKPLKGSCGGLSSLGLKKDCPVCGGGNDTESVSNIGINQSDHLFYNAVKPR